MNQVQAFPLCWPVDWPRTGQFDRTHGRFGKVGRPGAGEWLSKLPLSITDATGRILAQLELMQIERQDVIVSTNVRLRLDGLPRSGEPAPADPGAAVYWQDRKGRRRCMAVDRYAKVADNLAAIAATLEAMRAIRRHGGAEILERAFTGFVALPAPDQPWQVLGVPRDATPAQIQEAYRRLASMHHPDRGGDPGTMAAVNAARDALMGAPPC